MLNRKLTSLALLFILAPIRAQENDWPGWRGPRGTGVSDEVDWSPVGKDDPLWKAELGHGHSSFAVVDGRVYTMGHDLERGLDVVYCLEAGSGDEIWRHQYPSAYWNEGHDGGTCTTPTVAGNTVFTSNREGSLHAFDAETGDVRWTRQLVEEMEIAPPQYGFAASPLAAGNELILNVGRVLALEQATGRTLWATESHYGNAYSTPALFDHAGAPAVMVLNGEGLALIDRDTTQEVGFLPFARSPQHATLGATPIDVGGRIFLSGQHGGGCVMLEPTEDGLTSVWSSRLMRTTHSGCVQHGDYIYGFDRSMLVCIDLEGRLQWRQRGIGLGALSVAGDRLIVIGARGELIVAEATPEEYRELSRRTVLDEGAFWSTPVLSNGLIYVRNSLGSMVCLDHRGDRQELDRSIALPDDAQPVAEVLARHLAAVGGREALSSLESLSCSGTGQQHMGGPIDNSDAELLWLANGHFRLRFSSGFEFAVTPQEGWVVTQHGPSMLPPNLQEDLREAADFQRGQIDGWGLDSLVSGTPRIFDDRACQVLRGDRPDGTAKTLYFDAATGLLAGIEGEDSPLWTFRQYKRVSGIMLPTVISFFWPDTGAMTTTTFSTQEVNGAQADGFEPPEIIQMIHRSPASKMEAAHLLRAKYDYLLGDYEIATGNMSGTPMRFMVQDGALQYSFGGPNGSYLKEPDENDRLFDWCNPDLSFQIDRNEDGAMVGLRFFVQGQESGVLEPVLE